MAGEAEGWADGSSQDWDRVEPEIGPDSPVLRVSGLALMSGVTVHRRAMPGASKRLRRR
jgi:hypothetical protein